MIIYFQTELTTLLSQTLAMAALARELKAQGKTLSA
jgi:hypothetical protein